MSDDLVKRLREGAKTSKTVMLGGVPHDPRMLEAADRIEALEASLKEMRRMREAAVRDAEKAEAENARLKKRNDRLLDELCVYQRKINGDSRKMSAIRAALQEGE